MTARTNGLPRCCRPDELGEILEIINDAAQADVVIINTCSFIDSAQEESVETILESDALREAKNRGQGLIVAGCLPQRFREELPKLLPEVDAFMGIDQVTRVTEIVKEALAKRKQKIGPGNQTPKSKAGGNSGREAPVPGSGVRGSRFKAAISSRANPLILQHLPGCPLRGHSASHLHP